MNNKKKILIVDGSENIRKLVKVITKRVGDYEYVEAADAQEAMKLVAESQPDLVVMELVLEGNGGLELCRKMREKAQTPIIILTSETTYDAVEAAKAAGADIFIGKPFEPKDLRESVKELIG